MRYLSLKFSLEMSREDHTIGIVFGIVPGGYSYNKFKKITHIPIPQKNSLLKLLKHPTFGKKKKKNHFIHMDSIMTW
jgi:hypothetical protein